MLTYATTFLLLEGKSTEDFGDKGVRRGDKVA